MKSAANKTAEQKVMTELTMPVDHDIESLMALTGLSASSVRRALKALEARGLAFVRYETMLWTLGGGTVSNERALNHAERGAAWG